MYQSVLEVVRDLRATTKRKEKDFILINLLGDNSLLTRAFFKSLQRCYSYEEQFFIKKFNRIVTHPIETAVRHEQIALFDNFFILLNKLRDRVVTGHAALDAVGDFASSVSEELWKEFFLPILQKDIKAGITETSINKVLTNNPEFQIKEFTCMLAKPSKEHPNKLTGRMIIQPKYDGVRVLAVISDTEVTMYSRNGILLENFPIQKRLIETHIFPTHKNVVLDGEIMSENFQALMKQLRRKEDIETTDSYFVLFDIIPLDMFNKGVYDKSQLERNAILQELLSQQPPEFTDRFILPSSTIVDLDTPEGHAQMLEEFDQAVSDGLEGIMIKDAAAPYECKRSAAWLKMKPSASFDLAVVGYEEGTKKNVGKLGAVIVEGYDGGKFIRTKVGTGFTDVQREEFWQNRDLLIGKTIEFSGDCVTLAQDEDAVYSIRFPAFKRFRPDKD